MVGESPAELVERLRSFYVRRGFLDAEISTEVQGDSKDTVNYLIFSIREHDQVRVVKRIFPCLTGEFSADDVGVIVVAWDLLCAQMQASVCYQFVLVFVSMSACLHSLRMQRTTECTRMYASKHTAVHSR